MFLPVDMLNSVASNFVHWVLSVSQKCSWLTGLMPYCLQQSCCSG